MQVDPRTYPSKSFIRFITEKQLIADLTGKSFTAIIQRQGVDAYYQQINPRESIDNSSENQTLDEFLFKEIVSTTFHKNCHPELYQSCGTPEAASLVEMNVAAEVIETYRQIKQRSKDPIVEQLNNLL